MEKYPDFFLKNETFSFLIFYAFFPIERMCIKLAFAYFVYLVQNLRFTRSSECPVI